MARSTDVGGHVYGEGVDVFHFGGAPEESLAGSLGFEV